MQDNLAGHRILRASERAGDGAPPGGHEQGAGAGQGLQRRRRVKNNLVQERNHGELISQREMSCVNYSGSAKTI